MSSTSQNTSSTRLRRGAVAGGIAVLLLAGGGATWAGWNDTSTVGTGTVVAGDQGLTVSAGTWQLCRASDTSATPTYGNCVPVSTGSVKLVPGDQLQYAATVTPTLVGDNLKADLTSTAGTQTAAPLVVGAPVMSGVTNPLTPTQNGQAINASLTITFPWTSATTNEGQNATVDLSQITFTLAQVL